MTGQGQSSRSKPTYLKHTNVAIAGPWFKIIFTTFGNPTHIGACIVNKFGMVYHFRQNSMRLPGGGFHSLSLSGLVV